MPPWDRMHRDHRYAQRLMSDAVDDELSARQRARFVHHVDECPECGPMLRGLIRVRSALRAIGDSTSDDATVVPAVLDRLHEEPVPSERAGTR
ncbi:MAG: zf-HC2 domain-containing protein [Candidatus Nanopelagicales bacterium]